SLGTIRNNYTGWVGMAVRVGASPVSVSALGRFVAQSNSGAHTVKIVDGSSGADVPGASVVVSTSSATPGKFAYTNLPNAVTLNDNSSYFIVSQETFGGDQWYDHYSTLQTSAVASVTSAAYSSGGTYILAGSLGQSYGPVDFQYGGASSAPQPAPGATAFVV